MWQETAFSARSRDLYFSWDDQTFAYLFRTYQSQTWQAFPVERSSLRCLCCVLKDDQNTCDLKTSLKQNLKFVMVTICDDDGEAPQQNTDTTIFNRAFMWGRFCSTLFWGSTGNQPKLSPLCTWRHSVTS